MIGDLWPEDGWPVGGYTPLTSVTLSQIEVALRETTQDESLAQRYIAMVRRYSVLEDCPRAEVANRLRERGTHHVLLAIAQLEAKFKRLDEHISKELKQHGF